jgi:DNA-binding transcriptional LysR family regulator
LGLNDTASSSSRSDAASSPKPTKLGQSRRVVCAAPGYLKRMGTPQVPEDLRSHDCLTFNFRRTRAGWPFRFKGRELVQPVAGPLLVNNGETMKQMLLAGVVIGRVGLWHEGN